MRIRFVLIALVVGQALAAQEAAPDTTELAPGDAVRITAPALGLDKWTGWYVSADFDSVTVRGSADSSLRTLPLELISRFEANHGNIPPQGNAGEGAMLGVILGIVGGIIVAEPQNADLCLSSSEDAECSQTQKRGALYGAVIGGVVGGVIGSFFKTWHWVDIPINPPEVSVSFPPGSLGALGVAVKF